MIEKSSSDTDTVDQSKRSFLKTSLYGGALLMTVQFPVPAFGKQQVTASDSKEWCVYVSIRPDNSVLMGSPVVDMGQHMKTAAPMILAEEMDLDWSLIEFADDCPAYFKLDNDGNVGYQYANMRTGGSHAMRRNWEYMRDAGATVRQLLIEEAASRWHIKPNSVSSKNSFVINNLTGEKFSYGELAEKAAQRKLISTDIKLKDKSAFDIIGKPTKTVDIKTMVTGKPLYGIDEEYPNQKHAVIARCPYQEGQIDSIDTAAALKVPGVKEVVALPRHMDTYGSGVAKQIMAPGFAVIADTLWAAMQGKKALKAKWKCSLKSAQQNASSQLREFKQLVNDETYAASVGIEKQARRKEGDVEAALKNADKVLDQTYSVPLFAHACMEPYNCVADIREKDATVIVGHQFPDKVAEQASLITGLSPLTIEVIAKRIGGGFGRRWEVDFVREAIFLSDKIKQPLKVTWMREDEVEQGYFAPSMAMRVKAGLSSENAVVAWHHSQAQTRGGARDGCFPFKLVPNFLSEIYQYDSLIPTGPWRAPAHMQWAFAAESMVDELAFAAKQDPLDFRLKLMQPYKTHPHDGWGADTIDSRRMAACYLKASEMANWSKPRAKGAGLGIAGHFTFGSYAAFVVEVSMDEQNNLNITNAWGAIDCGLAVNPNHIENQMQGGFIDGLSSALFNNVVIERGKVINNNFDQLRLMRMIESPKDVQVHIINSDQPPTGVGEPPTPPAAAALANAIFAASGKRIRELPLSASVSI